MAKSRRSYKGAAVANTISSSTLPVGTSSPPAGLTISLSQDMSGWADATAPFFVVIDPGTAKEEKVCVLYTTAQTLTVVDPAVTSGWTSSVNGRGVDGTVNRAHDAGAVVYPVFTATEADQANELVSKYTTNGDIVVHGTTAVKTISTGGSGGNNKVLVADSTVADGGIKWSTIVDANVNASAAIALSKLATGALPTGITVASANLTDLTIATADIADGAITTAKIADGAIVLADLAASLQKFLVPVGTIAMYGGAAAPTGWLLCDGTSTSGYTALAAIVGATTPDFKGRFPIGDNATLALLGTGGSATIGTNNLPAHSHPNTATAATSVSLTDPGHSHTIDTFNPGTGGSTIGAPEPGYGADAGTEANVVNSNTTGITVASSTTTVTMTNANNVTTASDYYQPYLVVNYIIKHD